jgi:N-acetylmuramoyl-L-alanine amidase
VTVVATNSGKVSSTFGPLTITVTTVPVGALDLAVDSGTSLPSIKQNGTLYVNGWAADPTDGSPLKNVLVYIDGNSIGAPTLGVARPDVATYFGKPAYANSGFTMTYSVASLAVGTHAVTVVATNSQGISTTLGPLSITITAVKTPPVGNLDLAVDAVTVSSIVSQSDPLYVAGWAASAPDNGPATSVQILIDGVGVGYATLGVARPDVASYFSKPGWANSGWVFVISASSLPTGPHTVSAVASDSSALTTTLGPVAITVQ